MVGAYQPIYFLFSNVILHLKTISKPKGFLNCIIGYSDEKWEMGEYCLVGKLARGGFVINGAALLISNA